ARRLRETARCAQTGSLTLRAVSPLAMPASPFMPRARSAPRVGNSIPARDQIVLRGDNIILIFLRQMKEDPGNAEFMERNVDFQHPCPCERLRTRSCLDRRRTSG